jgi:hypothetical protein
MLLVSAQDQQTATAISKLANPLLLHLPLPTMNYLPSFAFATSPAHIDRGAAYEFVLNHVVDVDSPTGMFRLEMETEPWLLTRTTRLVRWATSRLKSDRRTPGRSG